MADPNAIGIERMDAASIESTIGSVKRMLLVGGVFVAVGYLLVGSAIVFELTEFHPALEAFATENTQHSLAGGGPERSAAVSGELAALHKWPSTLLWLKLGGVAHVLVGIFVALAAIVRVLSLMPHRLSYEMERTQTGATGVEAGGDGGGSGAAGTGTPADD